VDTPGEPEMLGPVQAMRRLREILELFRRVGRNADLRRVILAWATSNLASRASAIAVAVFAYQAGGAGAVGLIAFVRLISTALLAPVLGVVADRRSRRRVMIEVELVRGVLFGLLAVLVASDVPAAVYVLAVVVAIAEPVFRSAQAAITPSLVSTPEELTASNVLASGVESVGLFLGPALGALVIAATGVATVFWVSAGLVSVSIVLVARIGIAGEPSPEEHVGHRRSLLAGWQTIVGEPDLRLVIGLFGFQALVAGIFNVLVVVLAIEVLDLGTAGVGFLDGMVGVGALFAVVVAAGATARGGLASTFAAGLLLWGVPLMLVAGFPVTAIVVPLLLLVGAGNTLVDVAGITLLQRSAPDAVLGRVFGAFESVIIGSLGIGSLLAPALDAAFGPRGALLVAGAILPVVLLPSWRRLLGIDARGRVDEAALALLRGIPIFEPLPLPELERLALALGDARMQGGGTVFEEGDLGDRFYVIRAGEAEVLIGGERVRTLGAGQFFGEIALVRDVPRTATIRALTDLDLGTLERDVFVGTLSRHAASAEAVGSIVAARLPSPVIS
jgi:MFS family permease